MIAHDFQVWFALGIHFFVSHFIISRNFQGFAFNVQRDFFIQARAVRSVATRGQERKTFFS